MARTPACETIVQANFGSLKFLCAGTATRVYTTANFVICTTCIYLNYCLRY